MIHQEDLINRLKMLERSGQYDTLLVETETYLNNNPDLSALYYFKGNALRHRGELQAALSAYRWAILLDPNDIMSRTNYAATLFDLKDYVGALNAADAAILMDPDFPDPYLICGNILSLLGFPNQAMYPYHRAYDFMPDNIPLGAFVAELYSQQEEPKDAFDLMMKLLEKDQYNPALQLQMACMLCFFMQNGVKLQEVKHWANQWKEKYPTDFSAQVYQNIAQENLQFNPISIENIEHTFDALAETYDMTAEEDAINFINALENAMHTVLQDKKGLNILDIGCGTGLAASPAREYTSGGGALTGIDISQKLLDEAKTRHIYDQLQRAEALQFLSDKTESFDALIAANCFSYFADLDNIFAACAQALKPNGVLFFSIKQNTLNREEKILYPPYNYIFSQKYIRSLLKKNNLSVLSAAPLQEGSEEIIHDKKYFYVVQKQ